MTNEEIIAVIAHSAGKQIAFRVKGTDNWCNVNDPDWDFSRYDYKVASREYWVNVYPEERNYLHDSKKSANASAISTRIRCLHLIEEN